MSKKDEKLFKLLSFNGQFVSFVNSQDDGEFMYVRGSLRSRILHPRCIVKEKYVIKLLIAFSVTYNT